jgi:hypothetical protein
MSLATGQIFLAIELSFAHLSRAKTELILDKYLRTFLGFLWGLSP